MSRHERPRRGRTELQAAHSVAVISVLRMERQPVGLRSAHRGVVAGALQARR